MTFASTHWAVILGGSSGFGLATAHELARRGMQLFVVHRDRRGAMARIEPEFEAIRRDGVTLVTVNADALDAAVRPELLDRLATALGRAGRVRLLLHSIAFGNLKLVAPERRADRRVLGALAAEIGVPEERLGTAVNRLFADGVEELAALADAPAYPAAVLDEEDLARTIDAMGTSFLVWTQAILARGLFADDARVLGMTSEGNQLAWKGYAAVAAAKVALESVARAMAVELAPYGMRANVVQAGVTDTPALRAIPGHDASACPGAAAQSVPPSHHARGRGAGDLPARERRGRLDQRRGDPRRRRRARVGRYRLMLHLHGLGHFHPENEISNAFLEELDIGTTDEWILERVGIRVRRTTLPLDYIRTTRNRDPRAAAGGGALHARRGRSPRGRDGHRARRRRPAPTSGC